MTEATRTPVVTRAIAFGLMARAWALIAGPVTMVLIASWFSPETQGYYYTFASLIGLSQFVELGLSLVLSNFSAHEWSHLSLAGDGRIAGDPAARARLAGLSRFSIRWFGAGAAIFVLLVGIGGAFFLSSRQELGTAWLGPWVVLCVLAAGQLLLSPVWAILEGCNQIEKVYRFRLIAAAASNIACWLAVIGGAGLWTGAVVSGTTLILSVAFLFSTYRIAIGDLARETALATISWRREILPMQWRILISSVTGYVAFSTFTPVLFHYHGASAAGRMGMTWSLITLVSNVAVLWLATNAPKFGMLAARRDYVELDRLLKRIGAAYYAVLIAAAGAAVAGYFVLQAIDVPLMARLLDERAFLLFVAGQVIGSVGQPMSYYMRAHKTEPTVDLALLHGALSALLIWLLGKNYGGVGAGMAYLIVQGIIGPLVVLRWYQCRRVWIREAALPAKALAPIL